MGELVQSLPWHRDEAKVVADLQAGSGSAFDYIVTYYHGSVYNLIYGILWDAADAAEVTQKVFLQVSRGVHGFRPGHSLKTRIYRVAVRQALNHRRWCWRHRRPKLSSHGGEERIHSALELRDGGATPFEKFAAQKVNASVRRALAAVPTPFRSAVILRDLEGLSYEEVAEILEVSVGTVKLRILRGRRILKELLGPLGAAASAGAGSLVAILQHD